MKKAFLMTCIIIFSAFVALKAEKPIIDCNMSLEEALSGSKAPLDVINDLELLTVQYISMDSKLHQGQIIVHKELAGEVVAIFELMLKEKFPIRRVIPIVKYKWSDDASMSANNTSAFNYRNIANTTRLSKHSFGRAIDFNPVENPAVYADGNISPEGAVYNPKQRGTLTADSPIVIEFKKLGWRWGGEFSSFKDYQHFDKD